jgi:asparagine synthase (glutamine-hydrolysing)
VRWFGALGAPSARAGVAALPCGTAGASVPFDADPQASSLRRMLYFDQTSWLPDNLLERADRMTMAASIEARVPFLDHELAAFVSSLPDRFRVRGLQPNGYCARSRAAPASGRILNRPKMGFRVPVNDWFRGPMRDFLLDHLQSAASMTRAYYEPQVLDGMLAITSSGRQNHEKLLWTLLNLEIWHRRYAQA